MNFIGHVLNAINRLLTSTGQEEVNTTSLRFAFSEDITYGDDFIIVKPYDMRETERTLEDKLQGGPSWVHANLIRDKTGKNIIAFMFGTNVGNPNPTINVSYEDKEIRLSHHN
jgi:hypothetical protein